VLVVEDDGFMRSLIAGYLEGAGFVVATAATAVSAQKQIRTLDPDAVVLDIDLGPGPSGLDIAKTLNLDSQEIGLVFLTNFADPRFAGYDIEAAHPSAAYLNKHMLEDPSILVEALNAVLLETGVGQFRHDSRADRPFVNLSGSQIQALRLIAEGKTNQQIAEIRNRSLPATESLVKRTLEVLGIPANASINGRVKAASEFVAKNARPRQVGD
jgi:DNA-binding NarL/FixJ family response regulator